MPTYEYECNKCGYSFEILQSIKDASLKKCPKCGKDSLKKIISGGAGLIFKGSGFYLTDYKNKPSKTKDTAKTKDKPETKTKPAAKKE